MIGEDLHESLLCGAGTVRQQSSHRIIDGIRSGIYGDRFRGCVCGVDVAVLKVDGAVLAQGVASHDSFVHWFGVVGAEQG